MINIKAITENIHSEDTLRIIRICERYRAIMDNATNRAKEGHTRVNMLNLVTDVTIVHAKTGLDLEGLHIAAPHDLVHDLSRIQHYLNRETGELEGFVPRYTWSS